MIICSLKEEERETSWLTVSVYKLGPGGNDVLHNVTCYSSNPNVAICRFGYLGIPFLQFGPDSRLKEKTGQLLQWFSR